MGGRGHHNMRNRIKGLLAALGRLRTTVGKRDCFVTLESGWTSGQSHSCDFPQAGMCPFVHINELVYLVSYIHLSLTFIPAKLCGVEQNSPFALTQTSHPTRIRRQNLVAD